MEGLNAVGVPADLAMIIKQRAVQDGQSNQTVAQMDLVGEVKGSDCILVDDMIDTAGTLCSAAAELKEMGALRVFACASHGLFNDPAVCMRCLLLAHPHSFVRPLSSRCTPYAQVTRIEESELDEVVVANTLPLRPVVKEQTTKIVAISVGPLLAEAISRLNSEGSVDDLKADLAKGEALVVHKVKPRSKL